MRLEYLPDIWATAQRIYSASARSHVPREVTGHKTFVSRSIAATVKVHIDLSSLSLWSMSWVIQPRMSGLVRPFCSRGWFFIDHQVSVFPESLAECEGEVANRYSYTHR